MGIFSRIATFFKIRTSAALDRAEDPGQVLDYSFHKQLEQLQQIKRSIAEVATARSRLELQQSQALDKANQREQQARQALLARREDLARMALQEKETHLIQVNGLEQQIAQLREQEEKLLIMQRAVTARVEAFRTQKEMVKAQYNAAQAQVRIQETLSGFSEESNEMYLAMQRAQDKILNMQARAHALDRLVEAEDANTPLLPGENALDRELRKISTEQSIDSQLQVMKQQLQIEGPGTGQKQIEGPAR